MSTCNADAEFLCGTSRSGGLDMKNVACQVETELAEWNLGVPQPELPPPSFTGASFGLSLASTWRGSLVATTGRDQDEQYYIVLHRSAGSHWVTKTKSVMRSSYTGEPGSTYGTVMFGWEVQMADIMPNAVANKNNRMPVHVVASGMRHGTSDFTSLGLYLDAFYCSLRFDCIRPRFLFDPNFYNGIPFFPDLVDDFLPPPPIENATMLYEPNEDLYSTFFFPLPFSLSRDGRYLALAHLNSFTIQEWQFPDDFTEIDGTWAPSFGTKLLGLDSDDLAASILYMATSDDIGDDNQEILLALGLLRSNHDTIEGIPLATP